MSLDTGTWSRTSNPRMSWFFGCRTVFLDGSSGVGSRVDVLDEDEARDRLVRLFDTGYQVV